VKKGDQFLTRSKNTPYDAGVRTPILIKWPGKTRPVRSEELVSTIDIAPTILMSCGVSAPKSMTGLNLHALSLGQVKTKRDAVFGEIYLHTSKTLESPLANLTHRWVRSGDWKLIVQLNTKDATPELFNLKDDPFEKKNRAGERKQDVERLTKVLTAEWNPAWK
jgi:uncharacterized sulfatase